MEIMVIDGSFLASAYVQEVVYYVPTPSFRIPDNILLSVKLGLDSITFKASAEPFGL